MDSTNKGGAIWIAIGLLVLLVLAVLAFGNTDAERAAEEAATSTAVALDASADAAAAETARAAARAEASTEIAALQARAEAGETYEALSADFAQIRARLATAYEGAEGAAAEEYADLTAGLDEFEASARAGTSGFLDAFANLIARFSADVRVETEAEAQ